MSLSDILYTELNVVGCVILLLMMFNLNRNGYRKLPLDQKVFFHIMLFNMLILLFDSGMWLTENAASSFFRVVDIWVTMVYFICNPILCLLCLVYADIKIFESSADLFKRIKYYFIPTGLSIAMAIASPLTGWVFRIDQANHYTRGSLFLEVSAISLAYLVATGILCFRDMQKSGVRTDDVGFLLLTFSIVIILAAVIQIRFFGVSLIWICTMLACVSIYINIQNAEISSDYLTGLYNRRRLSRHLHRRMAARKKGLLFAVILDLNDFKAINDLYGHMEGDAALILTAEILRRACIKDEDFIARFGGDEFIVVGERSGPAEVERLIASIEEERIRTNESEQRKYRLSFSIGYSIYAENDTEDSFLADADEKMYLQKKNYKENRKENHKENDKQKTV